MDVNVWHVREAFVDKLVERISVPYRPKVHLTDTIPRRAEVFRDSDDAPGAVSNTGPVNQRGARNQIGTISQSSSRPTFTPNKTEMLPASNGMRPVFVVCRDP